MDFSFSDEQEMLRDQVRAFLEKEMPEARVVELAESETRSVDPSWKAVADLGVIGLSATEDSGGAGMSFLDEVVVVEEMGRALYPGPYASIVLLAQPALERAPDLLGRVIAGEATATLAWAEPEGAASLLDKPSTTRATRVEEGWVLEGSKRLIADGDVADIFVAVAASEEGVGLWAVSRDSVDVSVSSTMDTTRRYASFRADGAPATLLAVGDEADELLRRIRLRALAGYAVEAVGVGQKVLELAQEHVKEREQFGKPIGSYQAVSHQVADAYMALELARSLSYWAAWCVAESDPQAEIAVAGAKSYAGEAAVAACERAIQVHGGIGFTWEHVLHRYYKRAQWLASVEGHGRAHRSRIADALLSV